MFTQPRFWIKIEQSIWLNFSMRFTIYQLLNKKDVVSSTSIFLWLKFIQRINDVVNELPDLLTQGNCNRKTFVNQNLIKVEKMILLTIFLFLVALSNLLFGVGSGGWL